MSKRIGNVGHEFNLPLELKIFHPVFHISMLKKCLSDPSLVVPIERISVKIVYPEKKF